jgi:hypothetical protein
MATSIPKTSEAQIVPPPGSWAYRWARLKGMERGEVLDRLRQALAKRWDFVRFRLNCPFDQIRLRPVQTRPRFFFESRELPDLVSLISRDRPEDVEHTIDRADRICRHCFDLLGYSHLDFGQDVDWHLDPVHGKRSPHWPWYRIPFLDFDQVGDAKIIWELNRHQHLVTLAKAYRLSGNARFAAEIVAQISDWLARNPYPIGINWASSLEVSFRSLSWLWVIYLMDGSPHFPADCRLSMLRTLNIHGRHIERYLSSYFSANTHLLGEGVALFFLGTLCPELPRAGRWQNQGWKIVLRQAERQVQDDGLHFEQSTYYHVYALDFFLHARILASTNGVPVPAVFDETLQRMLQAQMDISQAGIAPRFGDDDGGRLFDSRRNRPEHMLDPLATGAALFQRQDFALSAGGLREETLWLLYHQAVELSKPSLPSVRPLRSLSLPAGGLYAMAGSGTTCAQLVIDAGPQGYGTAGHSHADALSVQLSAAGRQLLLDPGTYQYVGPAADRDRFRGTGAHNTLQLDGRDQAQPIAAFRWTGLPRVDVERWQVGDHFDFFVGSHHGYEQLPGSVVHQRAVFFFKPSFWLIRDVIAGTGFHHLEINWHLGKHLTPGKQEDLFVSDDGSVGLAILGIQDHNWSRSLEQSWCSPAYGYREPITVLRFAADAKLSAEFATLLIPLTSGQAGLGKFSRIRQGIENASGYFYRDNYNDHWLLFSNGQPWHAGSWSSDAGLLYYRVQRGGSERELVLLHGSRLEIHGRAVIKGKASVAQCEILSSGGRVRILSPQADNIVLHQPLEMLVDMDILCPAVPGLSIGS